MGLVTLYAEEEMSETPISPSSCTEEKPHEDLAKRQPENKPAGTLTLDFQLPGLCVRDKSLLVKPPDGGIVL